MKLVAKLSILAACATLVFHFLFFFVTAIADSRFYWAIGTYFTTGTYPFAYPFLYAKPTTISPPAYGMLLMLFERFPSPHIWLHGFQLLVLSATGYLIYRTARYFVSGPAATIIACLFVMFPTNLIYASQIMTENGAQVLLILYVFLLVSYFKKKQTKYLFLSALVGSLSTLWKYSFLIYGVISIMIIIFKRPKPKAGYILPGVGMAVIIGWLFVNYSVTGIAGVSDAQGINLYNQIVWYGNQSPPPDSKAFRELMSYAPQGVDYHQAYWNIQHWILPHAANEWKEVERILGAVARDTIRAHPAAFLTTAIKSAYEEHSRAMPYWENTDDFGTGKWDPYPPSCDTVGKFQLCEPVIKIPGYFSIWNAMVTASNFFYLDILPKLWIVLAAVSMIGVFSVGWYGWVLGLLYAVSIASVTFTVHMNGRYIIPFYPITAILLVIGISKLWRGFRIIFAKLTAGHGRGESTDKLRDTAVSGPVS